MTQQKDAMEIITGRLRIIPFTVEVIQSAMKQDSAITFSIRRSQNV